MAGIGRPDGRQTVLVTGGTGGIGKATAIGLAAAGAWVGITGREIARTRAAAADLAAETPATAADTLQRAAAILTARDARIDGERHDASSGTATCHTALTRPSRLKHLQAERTVVPRHRHPAAAPCATVQHRTVPAGGRHRPASAATRHT
jgi:nucleoside-diphosphate-sugar epimerase